MYSSLWWPVSGSMLWCAEKGSGKQRDTAPLLAAGRWPLAHSSPWSLDCTSTLSYGRGNKQTDRQTNAFLHLNTLMPIYAKFCTDSFHPFHHGLTFQFVSTGFISQNLNPGTAVLLVLTVSISLFAKVQSNLTFIWQVYF